MDKLKQWVAFTVVGVVAVLAAGWFLLVSPKHQQASDLNAQTASADQTNQGLRTALSVLKAQAKDEPAQEAKIARVATKIPDNPALPALIRDLDKASITTGVDLVSLSPSVPSLVAAPSATTPTAATTPVAPGAVPVRAVAAPAAVAGSLAAVTVNMSIKGTYFQTLEFVDQLETLDRAFKVSNIGFTPGSTGPGFSAEKLTVSITGNVYMAAGRQPLTAVSIPKSGK